jgi:hypothetical protein
VFPQCTYLLQLLRAYHELLVELDARRSLNCEDWEGLADYGDVIDRYSNFAKHFKLPTNKQVSDVLAKLDADSPDWDRTQPEQFYSALAEE